MDNRDMKFLKNLSLLTYIGLAMIIPIMAGFLLGNIIDRKIQSGNAFMIIFTMIGIAASFFNVYKIIMKSMDKK
ncbi:F0F1-type ATP synthase assembly protein I [Anaerosolibacter carboniphilus]|uniref:F0F1-type ATP synthase assembly protein I n=1 Tax=Anaerosolibacter carboniphilus TaxID=1417629 RepID=A0A841KSD7_9FIRM|nr:AtpZ/AtpI family protein [Anaerosolibacter carboniphilus]MBB6216337.1 F0F1-type ATP synthase assembly protein I [Anaerosolibacter carboniphilus]